MIRILYYQLVYKFKLEFRLCMNKIDVFRVNLEKDNKRVIPIIL